MKERRALTQLALEAARSEVRARTAQREDDRQLDSAVEAHALVAAARIERGKLDVFAPHLQRFAAALDQHAVADMPLRALRLRIAVHAELQSLRHARALLMGR